MININPIILCIENTSSLCSISINYKKYLFYKEIFIHNNNSQYLLDLIDNILNKNNILFKNITCLAFGIGPGSLTGLKTSTSLIQGLSLGWNIPIINVSSLHTLALEAWYIYQYKYIFVTIDVNANEIYYNLYIISKNRLIKQLFNKNLCNKANEIKLDNKKFIGIGTGCYKYKDILLKNNKNLYIKNIKFPKAIYTNIIAKNLFNLNKFNNPIDVIPIYIK